MLFGCLAVLLLAAAWLGSRATVIKSELQTAMELLPVLKEDVARNQTDAATETAAKIRAHTSAAREASADPLWTLASVAPILGTNFSAVAEVAQTADDVSTLGLVPLAQVFDSLKWDSVLPSREGTNFEQIQKASPVVSSAAHAVRASAARLDRIDATSLLPQVAGPLQEAREQLSPVAGALETAANASQILPEMLGASGRREYLLVIQNNAESRATGGIPGALAVLTVDNGKISLGSQSTANEVGVMSPVVPVDNEQRQIYSTRLGKFMQDVNLTPDFPTAAVTARAMWERKTGQLVDGVVSIDPVSLGYVLDATGPIKVGSANETPWAGADLPKVLDGGNVVRTLLSDVYAKIQEPAVQDAYFASVAQEIFSAISSGNGDAGAVVKGITRATAEGRVLVWSDTVSEQEVLLKYAISGSIAGPSISPAQFGVYFNDGTGAKMDYYVKRTVQLMQQCPRDGYIETKVRVTSMNTAPSDAATSLPPYVTGAGAFGVPPGTVQTNVVAYGPVQSNVESVVADGTKVGFASQLHSGRPVGTVTVALPPGKSSTIDFTFGKIVQHTEPQISVTPTVQARKDVILDTVAAECSPPA